MTGYSAERSTLELRRYWDIFAARWPVVAVFTGLGLLAGFVGVVLGPSTYVATTTVSVFPITTDPYASNRNSSNLVDMSAEAVTASSFRVAEIAADGTAGMWGTAELRRATDVMSGADSTTMTIQVGARTEQKARFGAEAMAKAYLTARSDQAADSIDGVVTRDSLRIDELRVQLADAIERLSTAAPGSSEAAAANADQQTLNLQISALTVRISSLEGIDTTGGVVLNPASMTAVVISPSPLMVLGTAGAVGFGVGVIVAFLTHSRSKRVTTAQQLRRSLGVESLGLVRSGDGAQSSEDIAMAAQRILRATDLHDARVVGLVFDHAVGWPSTLPSAMIGEMRKAGVDAALTISLADIDRSERSMTLILVAPDSSRSDLLGALRISDAVIPVVAVGSTRLRELDALLRAAGDMGAASLGALLIEPVSPRTTRRERGRGGKAANDVTTPVKEPDAPRPADARPRDTSAARS